MGVKEVDIAFTSMINMSAELLKMSQPRTTFTSLKPRPKRLQLAFDRLQDIASPAAAIPSQEYQALLSELRRFEPSVLTLSALEPGQGVSFTATNIARLWAEAQPERKILLLEFYNGSSGCEYDIIPDETGQAVSDPQLLEEYIACSPEDNLYLLSIHAASIMSRFDDFFERLQASFDLLIIDAAPKGYNIMTDEAISRSTGVILISAVKPDPVRVKAFTEEVKELSGRFLGVVLNAID